VAIGAYNIAKSLFIKIEVGERTEGKLQEKKRWWGKESLKYAQKITKMWRADYC
jgi:hypothetical protein